MKNWQTKAVSTLLAFAVLVPSAAFAADAVNGKAELAGHKGFAHHQPFNQEKQQEFNEKLIELVTKYTPDSLTEWQSALAKQDQLREEMKDKRPVNEQRPELSEEVKAKVEAIREDVKNGKITKEQAQEQLQALGLEKIRDKKGFKGQPQLSDKAKQQLQVTREDVKSDKLTKEQTKEEMKKRNLDLRKDAKDNPMASFHEAIAANDETKIKEFLPQMLEQLKEKNQQLSNKLTESN
ncbi:hypothetical protein [Desulfotomaculum sp. 1211_IL3151]|uniref:hypothetical protein n=1 Tax=Desulfotomaculum sp. 1211_IL3151 TaxID=3084055 RepID=UPI002FD93881